MSSLNISINLFSETGTVKVQIKITNFHKNHLTQISFRAKIKSLDLMYGV